MTRSFHIVTMTSLGVAVVLAGCFQNSRPDRDKSVSRSESSSNHDQAGNPNPADEDGGTADKNDAFTQTLLTEADLARSSWESPFHPRLWSCDGWRIDQDTMTCEAEKSPPATFLRPYRNVVIECRFSPMTEVDADLKQAPFEFEVRLLNQSTQRSTSLWLNTERVVLSETQVPAASGTLPLFGSLLIREVARGDHGDQNEVDLRLTVTPNRLLVAVNGQMKINATRPKSIMNTECLTQFIIPPGRITLSDLRFEGD